MTFSRWIRIAIIAGLVAGFSLGITMVLGQGAQPGGPLTEPLPHLGGAQFEKAVVVKLTTDQEIVSLVSAKVLYGRARTTIGDPQEWLARPLDDANQTLAAFGVWDPQCREVETASGGLRSECVDQTDFTVVLPFSSTLSSLQLLGRAEAATAENVKISWSKPGKPFVASDASINPSILQTITQRNQLILVDLEPAISIFCSSYPDDPHCGRWKDVCVPVGSEQDLTNPILIDFEASVAGKTLDHMTGIASDFNQVGVEIESPQGFKPAIVDMSMTTMDAKSEHRGSFPKALSTFSPDRSSSGVPLTMRFGSPQRKVGMSLGAARFEDVLGSGNRMSDAFSGGVLKDAKSFRFSSPPTVTITAFDNKNNPFCSVESSVGDLPGVYQFSGIFAPHKDIYGIAVDFGKSELVELIDDLVLERAGEPPVLPPLQPLLGSAPIILAQQTLTLVEGTPSIKMVPSTVSAIPSQAFEVQVTINPEGSGVSGAQIEVKFDTGRLEFVGVSFGQILGQSPLPGLSEIDSSNGTVTYSLVRRGETIVPTPADSLATLTFKVREDARAGNATVQLSGSQVTDGKFETINDVRIPQPVVAVAIELEAENVAIPGDLNQDRVVNHLDLAILGSVLGLSSGESRFDSRADLNGDGEVGLIDLSILGGSYGKTAGR